MRGNCPARNYDINNNNVIDKDVYRGLVSKRLVTIIGALL